MLRPVTNPGATPRVSAYYWAPVPAFLSTDPALVLGTLAAANTFPLDQQQRDAWEEQIEILKRALNGVPGAVFLEFEVPRLGSRIDAVVVSGSAIFPIEFKCGEEQFQLADYNQAWDYALDLKNFHEASHHAPVFPILVATGARRSDPDWLPAHADGVRPPCRCQASDLGRVIHRGLAGVGGDPIDGAESGNGSMLFGLPSTSGRCISPRTLAGPSMRPQQHWMPLRMTAGSCGTRDFI